MNQKLMIAAAMTFAFASSVVNAKDMYYTLAARWCSTEWENKPSQFEITEQGVLFDGIPGKAPACKLKHATKKNEPFGEHVITWRCDLSSAHEPEDKQRPGSRFYEVTERVFTFMIHDSAGGRRFFMVRDKLPLGRAPVRLYEQCRD
jgi:hypothetical protein